MASENTIIIDVEVNASEAAKNLSETTAKIAALKKEQKELSQFIKAGADVTGELSARYAENSQSIKDLTAQEKMYTAQLNVTTQGNTKLGDSYIEMSRTLAALKQEYRGLSEEQRKSAGGQELLKNIQDLDTQMKEADASMGDYQRNVGNYQSALEGLGGRALQVGKMFQGGFKNGLMAAGQAVKSFGKMLLTTPVGWIAAAVAALIAVFKQLQAAFKRNDDAGTALSVAMSKLQPVITLVSKAFDTLAIGVAKFVGFVADGITLLAKLSPKFRENQKAAEDLVIAEDKLEDKQREFATEQAKRNEEIAKLNKEARSNENLTAKEREEIYKQMDELSRQNMEDAVKLAQEEYDNLVESNKQKRKLSDEDKDREVEYYNKLIEARTNYYNETTRIASREMQARKEQAAAEEAERQVRIQRWREVQAARREAAKTELDELRKLEDMTLRMITDATEQQVKQTEASYNRQVEDLRTRLNEEKNLTTKTKKAITEQIVLLEQQRDDEVKKIQETATREALDREIAAARAEIDAKNAIMEEGLAKEEAIENTRAANEIADLQMRLNTEKDLTISEQQAINAQIEALTEEHERNLAAIRAKYLKDEWQRALLDRSNELEAQLLKAGENAVQQAQAQLAAAQLEYDTLHNMDKATKDAMFKTEEEYTAAVLASERQIYEAKKANEEALKQQVNEIGQTMQAVTGALSSLFEAAAEDSEQYEKFKKAMAIVDATIQMATTIAAATAISATEGDAFTMAIRIAANVAAVTAQFAAVIKAIKAATIPSAGSFAEGGVVEGTSYTGDKMTAHVNSGEMILTKQMQLEILKLLANGVPSGAINYNRMREAFADALKEQKAPVLVYSEFEDFQSRRKKIQSITQL